MKQKKNYWTWCKDCSPFWIYCKDCDEYHTFEEVPCVNELSIKNVLAISLCLLAIYILPL